MKRFFVKIGRFFWSWGFLECVVAVIVLVVLFYIEEDWRGAHDWAVTKAKWEAKGESFDFNKFIPPPVPDEENIAALPLFRLEPLTDSDGVTTIQAVTLRHATRDDLPNLKSPSMGNWQKGELTDMAKVRDEVAFNYAEACDGAKPPENTLAQFSLIYPFFSDFMGAAATRPLYRINQDYKIMPPVLRTLGAVTDSIRLAKVLTLHAVLALDDRRTDLALQDIKVNYAMVYGTSRDPSLVGGLVAIGVSAIDYGAIYDGLEEHDWSDAQLIELDKILKPATFLADFQFAMRCEAAQWVANLDDFRRHARQYWVYELYQSSFMPKSSPPWPDGWWDENKSAIADFHLKELATVDPKTQLVFPNLAAQLEKESQQGASSWEGYLPWRILSTVSNGPMTNAVHHFAQAQVYVDETRIACALERYRLARGVYPGTLAELAPAYIDEVPHDIMSGQPYHYRLNVDGTFLLYSVGWNQIDDGGTVAYEKDNPKSIDYEQGDWVWPTPKYSR